MQELRLGVDLGGTKIEAAALDPTGVIRLRRRVATPQGDYEGIVRAIVGLIRSFDRELGLEGSVGIGIPGMISPATGLIKNANSVCLIGKAFDRDLAEALGRPVRLANDADCFALSEATDGAGAAFRTVFGTILGTGVGGGIVIAGDLVRGANAIAGEWGHNPLPWPADDERPGSLCYCGRRGCIETFLSGPGLVADFARSAGNTRSVEDIVAQAEAGEVTASAALFRYEGRLARAFATIINVLDPDVIVVGGGLSNIERLYRNVPARWSAYVFSDTVVTRLEPPRHGDASGVRGAAWLWNSP